MPLRERVEGIIREKVYEEVLCEQSVRTKRGRGMKGRVDNRVQKSVLSKLKKNCE